MIEVSEFPPNAQEGPACQVRSGVFAKATSVLTSRTLLAKRDGRLLVNFL
jgi:hypothetical protein